jgi:hypothetical protein
LKCLKEKQNVSKDVNYSPVHTVVNYSPLNLLIIVFIEEVDHEEENFVD